MALNISYIENLIFNLKITKSDLAIKIGMTREGLTRSLSTNKLAADKIELMAKALNVSIASLFDEPEVKSSGTGAHCERCDMLGELLKAKESEIETLKKLVAMHEGDVGRGKQAC